MDIHASDEQKVSLLHQAAYCGQLEFVKYLISKKISFRIQDKKRRTPFYYAAAKGQVKCLEYLLSLDSDQVYLFDTDGRSALDAASFGNHKECALLITSHLPLPLLDNFPISDDGRTPLHANLQSSNDSTDITLLRELIKYFDVNAADKNGRTALHRTVYRNMPNFTNFLLENGADVNIPDNKGRTVLMLASFYNYEEIVNLLENCNPDRSMKDYKSRTVDYYIKKREEKEAAEDDEEEYDEDDMEEDAANEMQTVSVNTVPATCS